MGGGNRLFRPGLILAATLWLSILSVSAATVTADYGSASAVPVTAAAYVATGNTVDITLNFAPPAGTDLTIVDCTGLDFIQGTFDNLAQGQEVTLRHAGVSYPFVANYFGGTGNDLVLQWANTRLLAWGSNYQGKLGNDSRLSSPWPVPVVASGILAGKTITSVAAGSSHSLALCADGTLAAWGDNLFRQLGIEGLTSSKVPVAINNSGALAGKTIIAISVCNQQSLVLCSDNTLVAWGNNLAGTVGNNTTALESGPVAVDQSGVLAGKTVVDISMARDHALVLCSDGTMAAWGSNNQGQLGTGSGDISLVPVRVDQSGALAGKTVVAISAMGMHNLALCSDGTLVAWGFNLYGQLGNNSTVNSLRPTRVNQTGVLFRKRIVALSAGTSRSLVLAADGALAAWGANVGGQLGNNSTTDSLLPVLVDRTGVLAGRTVTAIASGNYHSLAFCTDGTLATWGGNTSGPLGYDTTSWFSSLPGEVNTSALKPGEAFVPRTRAAGEYHTLAVVASPPAPSAATTMEATGISDTRATLNGSVDPNGTSTRVLFEYGPTTDYGTTAEATPATLTGSGAMSVSAPLTGLISGTTYHFRVIADSPGGVLKGEDMTFATRAAATLSGLEVSTAKLTPVFAPKRTRYHLGVANATDQLTITPVAADPGSSLTVNGTPVASGTASGPLDLMEGDNLIEVLVTGTNGVAPRTYTVTVTRLPQLFRFDSADEPGVAVAGLSDLGGSIDLELNFAPSPGTALRVINNTGLEPIGGTFDNLAQGQAVTLSFGGISYGFVANYFGGNGNDLVLQWANTRVLRWGGGVNPDLRVPAPVDPTGILAGKTIVEAVGGRFFSLALCSDGTVAAWGYNGFGQLGNNSTADSVTPVAVDRSGVLSDKLVVDIAAGSAFSLALCSDGTVATWGNPFGGPARPAPVAVDLSGALAGKTVIAVSAGGEHSLALCSDGTMAAWGRNDSGQLGNDDSSDSHGPVAVDQTGVLAGKTVIAVSAGGKHSLALCSDGTLAAWGSNTAGQLGNGTTNNATVPVDVTGSGVLAGRTVVAIAAGSGHTLALCSDGTMAAWGRNGSGQLGNARRLTSAVPMAVDQSGVLAGKTITSIAAGKYHSLALCSDGTLTAWGEGSAWQLGNNSPFDSDVPVLVNTDALRPGERFAAGYSGCDALHSLGLVASPPPPLATTLAATAVTTKEATLSGSVQPNGSVTAVSFEYGLTDSYGATVNAIPTSFGGVMPAAVTGSITGLTPGAIYHYRVVATSAGGTVRGEDRSFLANGIPVFADALPDSVEANPAGDDFAIDLGRFVNDPDPGDTLAWSITAVSNTGLFRTLAIDPATGDLTVVYNPWAHGFSQVTIRVTDSFGSSAETVITFTLPPHPLPDPQLAESLVFNPQTGLYEHTLTVTNTARREIAGFDLEITGLPAGVEVYNASACEDGSWCVEHRQPLAAGAAVTLILEYYAPVRGTAIEPEVTGSLVTEPESDPASAAPGLAVDRIEMLDDGLLIEFSAVPGTLYEVQYSNDNATWKVSPTRLRAAGNRVQWIDRGPPRTDSPPADKSSRFYRVRVLPENQ